MSSRSGNRSDTNAYADGTLVRGGTENVSVTTDPSSKARADVGRIELPGALEIDGLRSTADAAIAQALQRRTSSGATEASAIDIGGLVRLEDVRWYADRTTGKETASTAGFSVGRITVAGTPLAIEAPEDLKTAFDVVNQTVSALGIAVKAPSVVRRDDGTVEVTPLVVTFGGNDDLNPVLGALFEQLQPVRDELYAFITNGDCPVDTAQLNAVLTVFDIFIASLSGSGGLVTEIGGARTIHDTTFYEDPLGERPPVTLGPPPVVAPPTSVGGAASVPGRSPSIESLPGSAGSSSRRCETTHPSGSPGCSNGAAALAGGLSLLVAVGLFAADARWSSRSNA